MSMPQRLLVTAVGGTDERNGFQVPAIQPGSRHKGTCSCTESVSPIILMRQTRPTLINTRDELDALLNYYNQMLAPVVQPPERHRFALGLDNANVVGGRPSGCLATGAAELGESGSLSLSH